MAEVDPRITELEQEMQQLASRARELGASDEEIATLTRGQVAPQAEETGNFQEVSNPLQRSTEPGTHVVDLMEARAPTDRNRRNADAIDAAARVAALGGDPEEAFQRIQASGEYDPDNFDAKTLASAEEILHQAEEQANWAIVNDQEVPDMEGTKRKISGIASESNAAMREAKAYAASIPSFDRLTPEEQEDAVFLKYLQFMEATVSDEIGFNWSTAGDMAGLLVPQENLRYAEVAKLMGVEYNRMDYLDYTDFLMGLGSHLRTLPMEDRTKAIERLIEGWPEIKGDNRIMLAATLGDLQGGWGTEQRLRVENFLERLDQGLILSSVATGLFKSANALRVAARSGNVEGTSEIIRAGARGELKDAGVDPLDAAASLDPSDWISGGIVKGADNRLAREVGIDQKKVDMFLQEAENVNTMGLRLRPEEQREAQHRAVERLQADDAFQNVRVLDEGEDGFVIGFNRRGDAPDAKPRAQEIRYNMDDLGGYVETGEAFTSGLSGAVAGRAASPWYRFQQDRMELVSLPEQMQFQGQRIRAMYDGAIRSALKPLSRRETDDLDRILISGDEFADDLGRNVGRVYSREELVEQGVNGVRLNDRQYQAYDDMRKIVDHMGKMKNREILERWRAGGVKLSQWGDQQVPSQVYDSPASALQAFRTADTRSHWIAMQGVDGANAIRKLDSPDVLDIDAVRNMYGQGYRLTRAREGKMYNHGGTNLEWAWVKADKLAEPSGMVLNMRTGYMPRVRRDAFYFVKENVEIPVGGTQASQLKTVRYFDNNMDAQRYADSLNTDSPGRYTVRADREMTGSEFDQELVNIQGGLFTGARASEPIPFGLSGTAGAREGSLEGLQRYVNNIARNMPASIYREALQTRWLNHARDMGALPKNFRGGFREALDAINDQHQAAPFLTAAHKQVRFLSGIRTHSEMQMLNHQRRVAQSVEKFPVLGKVLSRRIMNTSTDHLAGRARGITFNLLLGAFNPAQFFIQASGSFVALATNPIHGSRAVGQMMGYAAADLATGNPAQRRAFIAHLRSKGLDMDGYEAWERSGLRESITHTNMDYRSVFNDAPYNAGVLRRLVSEHTIFFKQGELVNARISFATAFNRWRSMPGNANKAPNTRDLQDIVARAEVYRLNMTRPNAAEFQKGLMSIPTQFMQVQTKYFEKLLGKSSLTVAERGRLIAGQSMLFGAAGIPAFKSAMPYMLEFLNNFLPEEEQFSALTMDPGKLNAVHNGLLAWYIQDFMDVDSVITGRMALGQDFVENIVNFTSEEIVLSDVALGPFGAIWDRAAHGVEKTRVALSTLAYGDEVEVDDLIAVGEILARSVADMPSSTANMMKAYDMTHSKFFKNRNGSPIAAFTDLNTQTQVFQALGFSPQEVADWHEINMRRQNITPRSSRTSEANRIVRLLSAMHNSSDARQERWHALAVNAIMHKYERPEDRVAIINQVKEQLNEPGNAWSQQMRSVLDGWNSELQNGLTEIHNHITLKTSPAVARQLRQAGFNPETPEE